jgi:DNA repair protein RadC
MTIAQARQILQSVGVVLTRTQGEYRINVRGGAEDEAYYTSDLEDAVATGKSMALRSARAPEGAGRAERARVAQPVGAQELSDAEVVAITAGITEVKAVELLRDIGGLRGLYQAGRGEITAKIGPGPAARLVSNRDLCQRLETAALADREKMNDEGRVWRWAKHHLARMDHEQLWLLSLDGRHGLISARQIAEGGVHGLHVGVRDVVRAAVREAASAFIVVHVHPSGDPAPSDEDIAFTHALVKAADTVGTPLLDHVIVTRTRYASMLNLGLLTPAVRR